MPPLDERLRLAELTMTALATPGAAQLPSKIAIHPRPDGSFVHAMPAHLRGALPGDDLVGMKWVAGFSTNAPAGLPAISALVVVNDPATGIPTAVLDGGPITAARTAAVSGVAIRRLGPRPAGPSEAAVIGAGVQGRAHLPVLAHVLPGLALRIHDRDADRAAALADAARAIPGIGEAVVAGSARDAVAGADLVVTAASFTTPDRRGAMTNDWLKMSATVVAVDYATYAAPEVAWAAALFVVDEREQFLANREEGNFDGYPDPSATLGEVILGGMERPAGRVLVTHLGVGLADVVFGDAIVRRAAELGLGTTLSR